MLKGLCMLNHFSCVWLFVTPWTVACQVPLSMGILQARILEWVAMPSSRGSSWPRDRTWVSLTSPVVARKWRDRFWMTQINWLIVWLIGSSTVSNGCALVSPSAVLTCVHVTKLLDKGTYSEIWLPFWLNWSRVCLQCGDLGSIQYSCLENSMGGGAWWV